MFNRIKDFFKKSQTTSPGSVSKEKDPVCHMTINRSSALGYQLGGVDYYFCSESCLNKFKQNPEKYGSKATGARAAG